jgi:hypothetical protein
LRCCLREQQQLFRDLGDALVRRWFIRCHAVWFCYRAWKMKSLYARGIKRRQAAGAAVTGSSGDPAYGANPPTPVGLPAAASVLRRQHINVPPLLPQD